MCLNLWKAKEKPVDSDDFYPTFNQTIGIRFYKISETTFQLASLGKPKISYFVLKVAPKGRAYRNTYEVFMKYSEVYNFEYIQ